MPRPKAHDYSEELRAALQETGRTRQQAADMIGVKKNTLDAWLARGVHTPCPKYAVELFRLKAKHTPHTG